MSPPTAGNRIRRRGEGVAYFLAVIVVPSIAFGEPTSYIGKPYKKVRAQLISAGWKPSPMAESSLTAERYATQRFGKAFPEVNSCASDRPVCAFTFVMKAGQCTRVFTEGEDPNQLVVYAIDQVCEK